MEVWAAPDGRYRVKSTSDDGAIATEEIAYDGRGNQLVLIGMANNASSTAAVVQNRFHYAVTGLGNNNDVRHSGKSFENILIKEAMLQTSEAMRYTAGNVVHQQGDPANLTVTIPDGVELSDGIESEVESRTPDTATAGSTTGSRTMVLVDLYYRLCIRIYNYRNSVSNLFYAYTKVIADQTQDHHCKYVHVAAWSAVAGYTNSWCDLTAPVDASQVLESYAYWQGFFEVTGRYPKDKACSSHAAWDLYWLPHITAAYLTAAVHG